MFNYCTLYNIEVERSTFLSRRHCGVDRSLVNYVGTELDCVLRDGKRGTGEELSLAALKAFEDVSRAVRNVSSLPLAINSVQGIHPVFRHTDVSDSV